jgi:hypothetical protein
VALMLFTSNLNPAYRDALEELLFFNPGQMNALGPIMEAVEKFGAPELYAEEKQLRVRVGKLAEVQSIFALDGEHLAGVLVYARTELQRLMVLHIAVAGDYSARGAQADALLVMRLLDTLRCSARRIKGIERISLLYGVRGAREFPIRGR